MFQLDKDISGIVLMRDRMNVTRSRVHPTENQAGSAQFLSLSLYFQLALESEPARCKY